MSVRKASQENTTPFDVNHLDTLMDAEQIDIIMATSKHSIQYLLGGYRCHFFGLKEAIGLSRYLPILVYPKGRPDQTAYIGAPIEGFEHQLSRFWPPRVQTTTWGTKDSMQEAVAAAKSFGLNVRRIGVESAFLPSDAYLLLKREFPDAEIVDAVVPLERLRARKTQAELRLLQEASERVVASMMETFAATKPGMTKRDIEAVLKRAEQERGINFEYCLMAAGTSHNRAISDQKLGPNDILSLDSGGNYDGYIGDLCRMGAFGEPDAELVNLLGAVQEIQEAARRPLKAGANGSAVYAGAEAAIAASPYRDHVHFLAHGMGLVAHEAPRLTGKGFVPYPGFDVDIPLVDGMVVSVETEIRHPTRGFIKLEDTVVVTADGSVGYGDTGRGWNAMGTAS